MQIPDTLDFLIGRWELERMIEDHRSGTRGSLTGEAVIDGPHPEPFAPLRADARYHEQGELRFGSRLTRASRRLLCQKHAGTALMFHFADGRPFVDLDLADGEWQSVHDCVDDRYEISTTVLSPDVLTERWRVSGPEKDYEAVTTLRRLRA